jgi:hypothetical protein
MTPEGRRRLGPRVARGEKVYVATAPAATRLPLAAVCFLHRSPARAVAVLREEAPDARELLASSFLPYVRSPERLLTHLDVCARIARDVPVYRIGVPRGDAQPAAAALAPRLRALAAESEDGR